MPHAPASGPSDRPLDRLLDPATDDAWRKAGAAVGLGRVALGVTFWVAPVTSVRVAGLDRTLSPWSDWLARMTAARDVAIGAGAAAAALRPDSRPGERAAWYLAGALADVGDAVSIRRGIREGRLSRLPALGASSGAAVAALAGAAAAGRELLAARRRQLG